MSQKLLNNVYRMNNAELIGLAKNSFLPGELQLAIAKTGYRRGHEYLAANEGLSREARDFLWSDECNRGYSLKALMLSYGQFSDGSKYWEFYKRYPNAWSRSFWRMADAFFFFFWHHSGAGTHTPSDLLNEIYDTIFHKVQSIGRNDMHYHRNHGLYRLARHPNVDLKLAIKLSQSGDERSQKLGFDKIVELSR